MNWTLPGTALQVPKSQADDTAALLQPMFLTGGMTLSQAATLSGLESYIIQNWVKRGFLAPPQKKRYTMRQLCRILNINALKGALPLEGICKLLAYINGDLADESDDLIDDAELYCLFVRLAARTSETDFDTAAAEVLCDYTEPVPGAKARITAALRIMVTAWHAAVLRQEAEAMLQSL